MSTSYRYINDGYLVISNISQSGCVSYSHSDREVEQEGERVEEDWNTHKTIMSETEQKSLMATRKGMIRKIERLGLPLSGFGVFVPLKNGAELEETLQAVEGEISDYNDGATFTHLSGSFTVFQITGGDERVAKALYDQTIDTLNVILDTVAKGDIKGLRGAIQSLKGMEDILPQKTGEELSKSIEDARKLARQAVKEIKEIGNEEGQVKKSVEILKNVDFDGVRASLVETFETIVEESKDKTFVPDLTSPREIE